MISSVIMMNEFDVYIANSGDYVHIAFYQPITNQRAVAGVTNAKELAEAHSLTRFFVNARYIPNLASTRENFDLIHNEFKRFSSFAQAKIAVLIGKNDTSYEFMEAVAQAAGFRLFLFDDEESAKKWLLFDR